MLIIRVELHSAITGRITEIARMRIVNTGSGSQQRGDYRAETMRGRSRPQLDRCIVQRSGDVIDHARLRLHVWTLVAKALAAIGYESEARRATSHEAPEGAGVPPNLRGGLRADNDSADRRGSLGEAS